MRREAADRGASGARAKSFALAPRGDETTDWEEEEAATSTSRLRGTSAGDTSLGTAEADVLSLGFL